MTGFLLRGVTTLLILAAIALGIFYAFKAAESEGPYSANDLYHDVVELVSGTASEDSRSDATDTPGPGEPEARAPDRSGGSKGPSRDVSASDRLSAERSAGREAFDRGDFGRAAKAWRAAQREQPDPTIARELAVAELFSAVLLGWKREYFFEGAPLAYLRLRGGDVWECRVLEDQGDTIHIKRMNGAGGWIPSDRILERSVYGPGEHAKGFEAEYVRRLDAMHPRTGAWCFELARWCFARKLDEHLPYLLRTALEEETESRPIIEAELCDRWERGDSSERERIVAVLERFYAKSPRSRAILRRHVGLDDEGLDGPDGVGAGTSDPVASKDASRRAAALARIGREFFEKAAPGTPDAAKNRAKALEALREAQALYNDLLDTAPERSRKLYESRLVNVNFMIFQLRKDAPIK